MTNLELQDWQRHQLEYGLKAADGGVFSSEEEIASSIARWMSELLTVNDSV